MAHPSSERETHRWLTDNSAAFELLEIFGRQAPSPSKLHRVGDLLWRHRLALGDALFARERELLGLSDTLVFHDLTNTHFTGRPQSPLARFGRSKQKRDDCPLATLALLLDAYGFPRHSDIPPGNVAEPGTLARAIRRFEALGGNRTATVVMDAGIATRDNLDQLRKRGCHWITVRRGGVAAPEREPDATLQTRAGHDARVWRLETGEGRTSLCVWSEDREHKDNAVLAMQRARFEEALSALHAGLSKKCHIKRLERVREKIGRLRERCRRVNRQYDVRVEPGEKGNAGAVHWSRNALHALRDEQAGPLHAADQSHRLGSRNRLAHMLEADGSRAHLPQPEIGTGTAPDLAPPDLPHLRPPVRFRSGLSRRPPAPKPAGGQGHSRQLGRLRDRLDNWRRITITLPATDGRTHAIRTDTRLDAESLEIASALGIAPDRIRMRS